MDDLALLLTLGSRLDVCPGGTSDNTRQFLARALLKVRDKHGRLAPLRANRAQRQFEARAAHCNIVLNARQLGITTWIAARQFLACTTRPGTLCVQVAHDQDS